jgi:protein TonB
MATSGTYKTSFLASVLIGLIVTALLLVALPLLTRIQRDLVRKDGIVPVFIDSRKPPPPPSEDRDKPRKQEPVRKEIKKQAKLPRQTQPKFDIPKVSLSMGTGMLGGIEIAMVSDFEVSDSLFMSAFRLTEVDQPPRPVRTFPPQYPYLAKRDNIEGRVMLKFVVDTDGLAKEPKVEESVPEGIFDEAALKALERYRFRPAVKNGKPVLCIVRLPIAFKLN